MNLTIVWNSTNRPGRTYIAFPPYPNQPLSLRNPLQTQQIVESRISLSLKDYCLLYLFYSFLKRVVKPVDPQLLEKPDLIAYPEFFVERTALT